MWYNTHIVPEKIKNVFILKKLLFSFVLLSAVLFGLFTFPTISHALETNMLKPMSTNVKNFKEVAVKKLLILMVKKDMRLQLRMWSRKVVCGDTLLWWILRRGFIQLKN